MPVERCLYCGNDKRSHQRTCPTRTLPEDDAPYEPPHWKNGFLILDLRGWCVEKTKRDFQELLRAKK